MVRRLSFTIFLAVLGSLLVFAIAVSLAWWWNVQARDTAFEKRLAGELAAQILPAAAEGPEQLHRVLERWHRRARIDLTVVDENRKVLAWAGRPLVDDAQRGPRRGRDIERSASRARLWTFEVELPDGRRLLARPNRMRPGPRPVSLTLAVGLLMLAGALVAWPISRRITHRLERLQRGVDQQGAGDLAARVAVEGKDEVAALARSFNRSAARIETLVSRQDALLTSQTRLLANASHELRSPLARIRMAMELLLTRPRDSEPRDSEPQDSDQLAHELRRNIAELDQLVDEILLASRLETSAPVREEVDLAGLAAEEASRVQADVYVADAVADAVADRAHDPRAMVLTGDSRLLRRMLRNLLENARRYGMSTAEPIRIALGRTADEIRIEVLDRGPGVPAHAREKIFEAFYRVEGYSEQAGGVGLGLALVKQIAEAHGGRAACEAREGGGSRFVVCLPA